MKMGAVLKIIFCIVGFISPHSFQDWGVGDYLHEVDDSIVKWLKDPSVKSKKDIFEMVADYLETLQDYIEKIDLKRKTAIGPGLTLLKRKQPRYLEEPFPEEALKTQHKWTDVEIDDFKRLLRETDLLWQDFEKSYGDLQQFFEAEQEPETVE